MCPKLTAQAFRPISTSSRSSNSICLKKIKAHPKLEDLILKAFGLADALEIEIIDVDHKEVVELARETGLTTYDCNYLWLARRLNGELITLDNRLRQEATET